MIEDQGHSMSLVKVVIWPFDRLHVTSCSSSISTMSLSCTVSELLLLISQI